MAKAVRPTFLMDSGASRHVFNPVQVTEARPADVNLGTLGGVLKITQQGKGFFTFDGAQGPQKMTLQNTLISDAVPGLNLVSVVELCRKGAQVTFKPMNDEGLLKWNLSVNGASVATGMWNGQAYVFQDAPTRGAK